MHDEEIDADLLFSRLPEDVVESLTPEQRAALYAAAHSPSWRRHPVNLRLSLPLLGRRFFLTIVAGRERRGAQRWRRERVLHPLVTPGNLAFVVLTATVFYGLGVGLLFVLSRMVG